MTLPADTAAMSCADILRSCQSAEDAWNLVRGTISLKETLEDELALQFVNMIFKVGRSAGGIHTSAGWEPKPCSVWKSYLQSSPRLRTAGLGLGRSV